MVGIPGGSKGCNTCRQRRVKCTEEKPVCSRCTRGGFACLGYTRAPVWHHLTTEPSSADSATQATLGRLVLVAGSQKKPDGRPKGMRPAAHAEVLMPMLPTQISLTAFQEDLCFAYIFSNFVWRGYGASWLHQSAQGLLGQLAFDSVKALAEISFGRSQKSHRTEIQGRLKYGRALRHMIERLGDGQKDGLWELVIPILLLLMHTTTLTNRSAAMFHLQAMTQILSACGPQMFQHQPFRDAFEAARATMVVASLVTRKRVFLDNPAWHTGPYALAPRSKAPQSYLLDILASVPGLLEDHHEFEQMLLQNHHLAFSAPDRADAGCFEDIATSRSHMTNRVVAKLESLFVWRLHWQVAFGSDVWVEKTPSVESLARRNAPAAAANRHDKLRFSRPGAAADIALYNAVLMWLLALINELEPLRAQFLVQSCAYQALMSMPDVAFAFTPGAAAATGLAELPSCEPLRCVGSTTRVRDAAMEICRVFEWQSANHASTTPSETNFVYMFPIGLALCVLDAEPDTRGWIRAMLDANALTRDYGVGYGVDDGGLRYASRMGRLSLGGDAEVGTMEDLGAETGILQRLQGFGWFVTRELADDGQCREAPNPNLVHLLLLRGRTDISA